MTKGRRKREPAPFAADTRATIFTTCSVGLSPPPDSNVANTAKWMEADLSDGSERLSKPQRSG